MESFRSSSFRKQPKLAFLCDISTSSFCHIIFNETSVTDMIMNAVTSLTFTESSINHDQRFRPAVVAESDREGTSALQSDTGETRGDACWPDMRW